MADHISISWIVRLLNWVFKPFFDFYFNQPKLYIYIDKLLIRTIIPVVPDQIDQVTWEGELVIKNNSKHDAYNLEFITEDNVFDQIDKLKKHNNLADKGELRLKFSWIRPYVHATKGLEIRQGRGDNKFPDDKKQLFLILKYNNEKGKSFYSVFTVQDNKDKTELFIFKPKLKK